MQQDPNDPLNFNEENDDEKHQAAKSPAVLDEENPAEPVDIDDALKDVGLASDTHDSDPEPLGGQDND